MHDRLIKFQQMVSKYHELQKLIKDGNHSYLDEFELEELKHKIDYDHRRIKFFWKGFKVIQGGKSKVQNESK